MFLFKNSKQKIKFLIILVFLAGCFWALNSFIKKERSVDYLSHLKELEIKEVGKDFYAFKTKDGNPIKIGKENDSELYLQLEKWEGEVFLKIKIPFKTQGKAVLKDNKLVYSTDPYQNLAEEKGIFSGFFAFAKSLDQKQSEEPRIDFNFYPKDPQEVQDLNGHKFLQNYSGGVEFDAVFYEKPKTNKLFFPIESKGLNFYYQKELTQKEKQEGASQPENTIGSFAIYHELKKGDFSLVGGKDYKTGKAFHVYRPEIKDSNNNECWGILSIENNYLIVEIPQEFLDKAVYPVIVDPNFGYETPGALDQDTQNRLSGSIATMKNEVGEVSRCFFYNTMASSFRCGIYTSQDSGLTASSSVVVIPDAHTFSRADLQGLSDSYVKDAGTYTLAILGTAAKANVAYDAGHGENYGRYYSITALPMFATFTNEDRLYSIYIQYNNGISNVIPVGYQQYSTFTTGVNYDSASSNDLSSNWEKRIKLDLPKPSGHPSTSTEDLYWGIKVPSSTDAGTYQASSTVEAVVD